jgi:glycosyltransferase involved in cell wall biosynthesis
MSSTVTPEMLRVLFVTAIYPPDIGGPATYVPEVAAAMGRHGMQVSVLTLADDPELHRASESVLVTAIRRGMWRPLRWLSTVLTIRRLGRQADVMYVNGLAAEAALANMLLAKPMVQKVVGDIVWERATEKGWTDKGFGEFQRAWCGPGVEVLKRFRAWWTRRADAVIVPSRFLAQCVAGWGVAPDRIIVVENAVRPVTDHPAVSVPLTTSKRVICVGRLMRSKRVDQIVDAMAEIPDAGLVVVGDGPELEGLQTRSRERCVADRVFFAGRRSRDETRALMASADVLALNSTYEGLPHVVLEALATGLSVVATAIGGTPEVAAGASGVSLVPVDDRRGFVAALRAQLALRPDRTGDRRERLEVAGRAFERMVSRTENVLRACAAGRKATPSTVCERRGPFEASS